MEGMAVESSNAADIALGRELRRLRKTRGLSLGEVAGKAGLSLGLISQVERGITSPSIRSSGARVPDIGLGQVAMRARRPFRLLTV